MFHPFEYDGEYGDVVCFDGVDESPVVCEVYLPEVVDCVLFYVFFWPEFSWDFFSFCVIFFEFFEGVVEVFEELFFFVFSF